MKRLYLYAAAGFSALGAAGLLIYFLRPPGPPAQPQQPVKELAAVASAAAVSLQGVAQGATSAAGNLESAQRTVAAVARERTQIKASDPFTARVARDVLRAADERRQRALQPVEQQLSDVAQQLSALQRQIAELETRLSVASRLVVVVGSPSPSKTPESSVPLILSFVGTVCALATLFLGFRRDSRDAEESELKIRELRRKLEEATKSTSRDAPATERPPG